MLLMQHLQSYFFIYLCLISFRLKDICLIYSYLQKLSFRKHVQVPLTINGTFKLF